MTCSPTGSRLNIYTFVPYEKGKRADGAHIPPYAQDNPYLKALLAPDDAAADQQYWSAITLWNSGSRIEAHPLFILSALQYNLLAIEFLNKAYGNDHFSLGMCEPSSVWQGYKKNRRDSSQLQQLLQFFQIQISLDPQLIFAIAYTLAHQYDKKEVYFLLGSLHLSGKGTPENLHQARSYWRAVSQCDARVFYPLIQLYERLGEHQNAFDLWEHYSHEDCSLSLKIASAYESGMSKEGWQLQIDLERAKKAYIRALTLYNRSQNPPSFDQPYGELVSKIKSLMVEDPEMGFWQLLSQCVSEAIENPDRIARVHLVLGYIYLKGMGTDIDLVQSRSHFERASQAGEPAAACVLAQNFSTTMLEKFTYMLKASNGGFGPGCEFVISQSQNPSLEAAYFDPSDVAGAHFHLALANSIGKRFDLFSYVQRVKGPVDLTAARQYLDSASQQDGTFILQVQKWLIAADSRPPLFNRMVIEKLSRIDNPLFTGMISELKRKLEARPISLASINETPVSESAYFDPCVFIDYIPPPSQPDDNQGDTCTEEEPKEEGVIDFIQRISQSSSYFNPLS